MANLDLSVVVPVYNEEESLPILNEKVSEVARKNNLTYEIIYVDDGSSDSSFTVLQQLNKADSQHVRVVQFRKNYGKAAGLSAGFSEAKGDVVITIDADLQDDPEEIPNLIAKIKEGYDLVSGWKFKRHDPLNKRIPSKIANFVTAKITGIKIHDMNCGLKAYRNEVVKDIDLYGELHRYIPTLAHLKGFRIGEIKVTHHPRKFGKTKYGIWRLFSGFFDLLTVQFIGKYMKRPLHFFGTIGLILFLLGFGIILYFGIFDWLLGAGMHVRPLLLFAVGLILVAVQFFSIGLLGEMLTKTRNKGDDYSIKRKF